jgi:hypothetical protein
VPAPGIGVITDREVHTGVQLGVTGTAGVKPCSSNAIGERRFSPVVTQGAGDPAGPEPVSPARSSVSRRRANSASSMLIRVQSRAWRAP